MLGMASSTTDNYKLAREMSLMANYETVMI